MAKCIYCKIVLSDESVFDVCRRCGVGVWGPKMFDAIVKNMEGARDSGNLHQGSVTHSPKKDEQKKSSSQPKQKLSLFSEAIETLEKTPEDEIKYDLSSKKENSTLDVMQEIKLTPPQVTSQDLIEEISL